MDTNKMRDIIREQFEDWADKNWPGAKRQQLERDEFGAYKNPIYRDFWTGWQASREAVVVELPETPNRGIGYGLFDAGKEACREAIEAQGLRVKP
jgi:hypothetical protein